MRRNTATRTASTVTKRTKAPQQGPERDTEVLEALAAPDELARFLGLTAGVEGEEAPLQILTAIDDQLALHYTRLAGSAVWVAAAIVLPHEPGLVH